MKWRRLVIGGLSGLAVGAVALVTRRRRELSKVGQPSEIPDDLESLLVDTEPHDVTYRGQTYLSQTSYACRPTRFFVLSVLSADESGNPSEGKKGREKIYHVSPTIRMSSSAEEEVQTLPEEKFYATLHLRMEEGGRRTLSGHLGKGYHLVFRKCHVGGSMNGVPTGEEVVTLSPVEHFEFSE